jgi:hypothetical protein
MASFGSGFAAGLNNGMSMGKMLMDTYNENKQKRDLEDATNLDQKVDVGSLDDEQRQQVQAIRDQRLDDGNAAYEVEDTSNGVRIRAAGNPEGQWGEVGGKKSYSLGGVTRDTEFSKEEIGRARSEAIADVYSKNGDPMRGLQYKQAAREERQAGMEDQILGYMRNSQNMSDDEFYQGLSKMATGHGNDGLSFGYAKGPGGENLIGMIGTDGKLVLQPATRDMAVSKLLQYASPKNYQQERTYGLQREEMGIKRDSLTETGRHNKATENILHERNGLMGGGGSKGQMGVALGLSDDGKGIVYNTPSGLVVKPLPAGVDGAKLFPKVTGLKGEEAQVEYDDGNGTKFKGTPTQIHNARMSSDGSYRAANGGNGLAVTPPASNQTGKAAPSARPAVSSGVNDRELDSMINDASRGGSTGKAYLKEALASGELNMNQRKRVEQALN